MQINTSERELYVKNVLFKNEVSSNYICTDLNDDNDKSYLLVQLQPEKSAEFIKIIMGMNKGNGYIDCFSDDGFFYIMFSYDKHQRLDGLIEKEQYSIVEKIEIVKNYFEKIILSDHKKELINEMINFENITLDESLCVEFNYCIFKAELCEFTDVQKKISTVIKKIFSNEENKGWFNSINNFCNELSKGKYSSVLDIYKQYLQIYEKIKIEADKNKIIEDKRIFIIGMSVKKIIKIAKGIFYWLIVIAAVALLIYTFVRPDNDKGNTYYKQIGDVKIKEYHNTETTEESVTGTTSEDE